MFEIIFFGFLGVMLIGALGLGYPESTYSRWYRH
jgi:hypothetical protein